MKIIRGWHNLKAQSGSVVTIGNFDGVHRGHQRLLEKLRILAEEHAVPTVVILFEPHPLEYFLKHDAHARIMRFREKIQALKEVGVDIVLCLRFTQWLAQQSPEHFVQALLVDKLNASAVVVGDDFRFGKDRRGDETLLTALGDKVGFSVHPQKTLCDAHERISSTRIRKCLAQGLLEEAAGLLGRPFHMMGRVVHGNKLGRTIGYPTANLHVHRAVVPLAGVFVVRARIGEGEWHRAVANLGTRPVVGGQRILLEVHLLDFDGHIYGQCLDVEFIHKIREELPVDTLAQLKTMIAEDVVVAKEIFIKTGR